MIKVVLCCVFFAAVAASASSTTPQSSILHLDQTFVQSVVNALTPTLSNTISSFSFNQQGGSGCASILLNAGPWIGNIQVGTSKTVTVENASSPSNNNNKLNLTLANIVVEGSSITNWTSQVQATVPGWKPTCFQICFGWSPFNATTDLGTSLRFSVGTGQRMTVTADSTSLSYSASKPWSLHNVTRRCVGSQEDFNKAFNQGVSQTVASAEYQSQMGSVFEGGINSVLSTATPSTGFKSMSVGEASKLSFATTEPTPSAFPVHSMSAFSSMATIPGANVFAISSLSGAKPLNISSSTSGTCVVRNGTGCTEPVQGATAVLSFPHCAACLQRIDDAMYFGFSAVGDVKSLSPTTSLDNEKEQQQPAVSLSSPPVAATTLVPRKKLSFPFPKRDSKLTTSAATVHHPSARFYATRQLLESVFANGNKAMKSILENLAIPSMPSSPLLDVEQYCNIEHSGFTFSNIPSNFDMKVVSIKPSAAAEGGVDITVRIPPLSLVRGTGTFSVQCSVEQPLGAPFKDGATGNFSVQMTPDVPSGSSTSQKTAEKNYFDIIFSIASSTDTAAVAFFPTLKFVAEATYTGAAATQGFTFDDYLKNYLVGHIGSSLVESTRTALHGAFTTAWVSRVQQLVSAFAGPAAVGVALEAPLRGESGEEFPTITFQHHSQAGTSSYDALGNQTQLSDVFGSEGTGLRSTTNAAILAVVGEATPFPLQPSGNSAVCTGQNMSAVCSPTASLAAPLATNVRMQSCISCVNTVNNRSVLGIFFDLNLSPTAQLDKMEKQVDVIEKQHHLRHVLLRKHDEIEEKKPSLVTRRRRLRLNRRRKPFSSSPSATNDDAVPSMIYIGTTTLTQGTSTSSAAVRQAIVDYTHPALQAAPVPYLTKAASQSNQQQHQCTLNHDAFSWINIPPTITPTVLSVSPNATHGGVVLTVELTGLPSVLQSNVASFFVNCSLDVDLLDANGLRYTVSKAGLNNLTLNFHEPTVTMKIHVASDNNTSLSLSSSSELTTSPPPPSIVPISMTSFHVEGSYDYTPTPSSGKQFVFDPYINNMLGSMAETIRSEVYRNVFTHQVWESVCGDLSDFTSTFHGRCAVEAFNDTHVRFSSSSASSSTGGGGVCGAAVLPPTPPPIVLNGRPLARNEVLYLLDAGKAPTGLTPTNLSTSYDFGSGTLCTTAVTLPGGLGTVAVDGCLTGSGLYNGHVVVTVLGTLPDVPGKF